MSATRPASNEYGSFYADYIARVPDGPIVDVLERLDNERSALVRSIPAGRETFRYAEGKWSIRELFGHLADGERVFGYRALCISRGEDASLPGFDENLYVETSRYHDRPLSDIAQELSYLRRANIAMFRSLNDEQWARVGTANEASVSVRALAWITAGHELHHMNVLRSRYDIDGDAETRARRDGVRGIGGVFFKSRDPKALGQWYSEKLGVRVEDFGGAAFQWRDLDRPDRIGYTIWSPFAANTTYFEPSSAPFMVNFRVDDLAATLLSLRSSGVEVDPKIEESEFGKFAWVMDPEGNRIELWEPPA